MDPRKARTAPRPQFPAPEPRPKSGAIREPGTGRLLDNFELMVHRGGGIDWSNARAQKAAIAQSRKQEDGGNSYRGSGPLTARSRLRPRRRD